jgi:hypothetical protein
MLDSSGLRRIAAATGRAQLIGGQREQHLSPTYRLDDARVPRDGRRPLSFVTFESFITV